MSEPQAFRLRVEGWQYARNAFIEGEKLLMEVAREACRHCPTCSRRIEAVDSRLRDSGVAYGWETGHGNGYTSQCLRRKTSLRWETTCRALSAAVSRSTDRCAQRGTDGAELTAWQQKTRSTLRRPVISTSGADGLTPEVLRGIDLSQLETTTGWSHQAGSRKCKVCFRPDLSKDQSNDDGGNQGRGGGPGNGIRKTRR